METDFKEILKEQSQKEFCAKKFGDYLFGEFEKYYGDELEQNTNFEDKVWTKIKELIRGEYIDTQKDTKLISAFEVLRKCMSDYEEILKPDKTILYRGISMGRKGALNRFNLRSNRINYSSHGKVQSWSTSKNIGKDWGSSNYIENFGILLKKDFSNSKEILFNTKFLNELAEIILGFYENEVIRISEKTINCNYGLSIKGKWIKTFDDKVDNYNKILDKFKSIDDIGKLTDILNATRELKI